MPQTNEDSDVEEAEEAKPAARKAKPAVGPSARPNDIPLQDAAVPNSTLSTRAKRVASAQNKAVSADDADTK